MGNSTSTETTSSKPLDKILPRSIDSRNPHLSEGTSNKYTQIAKLIEYARSNYEKNPTEALHALLQALKLNGGQESADKALDLLRSELGDEIADHVENHHCRKERAIAAVQELLHDENTFLHQRGKQDILRQAMEDGSSVVCTKCNACVSAARWQQHQMYWCEAKITTEKDDDSETDED